MNDLNNIENYEHYRDLINAIGELCTKAIEEGNLYCEDIVSALDRVKFHFTIDHIMYRFNLEPPDDEDNSDQDVKEQEPIL